MTLTVWTIGHSTHPLAEFLDLLGAFEIEAVADVRRFPGSRRQPQFQAAALETALPAAGIAYLWLPALGGRRSAAVHLVLLLGPAGISIANSTLPDFKTRSNSSAEDKRCVILK